MELKLKLSWVNSVLHACTEQAKQTGHHDPGKRIQATGEQQILQTDLKNQRKISNLALADTRR